MNKGKATEPDGAILFVFDEAVKVPVDLPRGVSVIVCPITTDFQLINSTLESIESLAEGEVTLINYAELFNKKAFSIRDSFVRFMAEFPEKPLFGEKNLKEYFVDRKNKFSLWWLTPIAEKNTVATASFDRLVALLTIIDLYRQHNCDELWLDIEDQPLVAGLRTNSGVCSILLREMGSNGSASTHPSLVRSALKGKVQLVKLAAKAVTARWAMRGEKRLKDIKNARYLIVSYFPFFDEKAWSEGRFLHTYFAPLQLELEKKHPGKIAWLAMFVRRDSVRWQQGLALGRQVDRKGYPLSFVEQWLSLRDLVSIAATSFNAFLKFTRCRSILKKNFIFNDKDVAMNIWPLFESDWYDSFCGRGLIIGLAYYRMFRNVFRNASDGATVLYTAEILAWEKALNLAAKERSDLRTVGIQHTSVPSLVLTYAVDRSELRNDNMVENMPRPDFLACVGDFTSRQFINSGWEESRVVSWAAIRHTYIIDLLKQDYKWADRQRSVVLALPALLSEAKELLGFVWQALAGQEGLKVIVKAHPICPVEPLLKLLKNDLAVSNFEATVKPPHQFLPEVRALIVTGGTVGLDSLACGCPVVIPRLAHSIDLNVLSGVCDLPFYANSPAELKKIITSIVDSESSPMSTEEARAFVREYFAFPEPDEGYLASLENAIGH